MNPVKPGEPGENGGAEDFAEFGGSEDPFGARPSARKRDRRGFDDFDDDLIRDPDFDFDDPSFGGGDPGDWEDPGAAYARYQGRANGGATERGVFDAVIHLAEMVAGAAGDALPAESRRRLEGLLRDLLVALRDALDRAIERLDERQDVEIEIEEIHID